VGVLDGSGIDVRVGNGDTAHPGCLRSIDAVRGVLDGDRVRRRQVEALEREGVDARVRLVIADFVASSQHLETIEDTRASQILLQPRDGGGGGHGQPNRQVARLRQPAPYPLIQVEDALQLGAVGEPTPTTDFGVVASTDRFREKGGAFGIHVTAVLGEERVRVQFQTPLSPLMLPTAEQRGLGVHQQPVEVEDHCLGHPGHDESISASARERPRLWRPTSSSMRGGSSGRFGRPRPAGPATVFGRGPGTLRLQQETRHWGCRVRLWLPTVLEMRRVRLLVELERRGSLAAVAEALHLSASGVSAQIARLEREVGTALVTRVGRGLRLTEAGTRLSEWGQKLLAEMEAAEADLRDLSGELSGTVRIAAFQSAALLLLPRLLLRQSEHPGLRIELFQAEPESAVPALLVGDYDLVVAEEYPGVHPWIPAETLRHELGEDPLFVVVDESLLAGHALSVAGGQVPWVMESLGSAPREWAELTCRRMGFEPDVRYQSDDLLVHLELIQTGLAAGMLPAILAERARPDLRWLSTGSARTLLTLTRRGTERLPALRVVRAGLRAAVRHVDAAALVPDRGP
jgi:molybdate transport repressor ModE-like protein